MEAVRTMTQPFLQAPTSVTGRKDMDWKQTLAGIYRQG